jgi:VanZ family protein
MRTPHADTARHRPLYTTLFYLYALIVLTVSSIPDLKAPEPPNTLIGIDKIAHTLQYFIFALLYFLYRKSAKIPQKEILIELALWGMMISILDEVKQIPIPGRFFEWGDVVANLLGFFSFIALAITLRNIPNIKTLFIKENT